MRERLEANGYDADIRGAAAYSTLGWFRDPVLSTLLGGRDPYGFIETLLRESVHATVHFESQSTYNESVARVVAGKGFAPMYLRHSPPPESASGISRNSNGSAERAR
jgi:predicted aminopeptidase